MEIRYLTPFLYAIHKLLATRSITAYKSGSEHNLICSFWEDHILYTLSKSRSTAAGNEKCSREQWTGGTEMLLFSTFFLVCEVFMRRDPNP